MSIEIGAFQVLTLLALMVGGSYAYWNFRSFLRVRRVVHRPRLSGRVRHGDERRAERAMMQRTFVQFVLWSIGTLAFIIAVVPRLVDVWQSF